MKRVQLAVAICTGMFLTSCVTSHTALITNNPVGDKTGVAEVKLFSKNPDLSFKKAKEDGGIDKVGIAETKVTQVLIFPKITLTVTGE